MAKRTCRYCGHQGGRLRPSVTLLGAWLCRDKDACAQRMSQNSPFTKR